MNTLNNIIITALFLLSSIALQAQSKQISLSARNRPIKEVFAEIQQKSGYRILYNDEIVADDLRVSVNARNTQVSKILQHILKDTDLTYVYNKTELIIVTKKSFLETKSEVFGTVLDENGKPMPFANVLLMEPDESGKIHKATVTDLKGNFEFLQVAHANYKLQISFVTIKPLPIRLS